MVRVVAAVTGAAPKPVTTSGKPASHDHNDPGNFTGAVAGSLDQPGLRQATGPDG